MLLTSLIMTVYLSYIFTYLKYMITYDGIKEDFFLGHTTAASSAKTKGYILLYLSLFLIVMMFLSMFRTVCCNPGYFPSPLELEYKILSLGKKKKKNDDDAFLSKFSSNLLNGPMTSFEKNEFEGKLRRNYSEQMKDNAMHSKYTNEEIMENNKREYMKTSHKKSSCLNCNTEIYLDIFNGIDLSKMTLCGTCLRIKVERSHHCRQCQKCVLKMDHHCPWLANCIGFGNLKYFILLQFYGVFACTLVAFTYWEAIVNYNVNYYTNVAECWFVFMVYLINIGLLSFLLWLCIINWSNLFQGMTVIENSEKKRFPSTKSVNIYDMGVYRNFTNVFGTNPLVWFIPFFINRNGNGYIFETNNSQLVIE